MNALSKSNIILSIKFLVFFILTSFLFVSCNFNRRDDVRSIDSRNDLKYQDSINDNYRYHTIDSSILFDAHRESMRKEEIQINNFVDRYEWNMKTSSTGLRYMIYEKGYGKKAEKGDIVSLAYTVHFLNGKLVYSSDDDGIKEFQISRSTEVSGLEEGVLLLHKGDKAKFIVPSYLGFGVSGDFNKISIKNTLVYDITLVDIK